MSFIKSQKISFKSTIITKEYIYIKFVESQQISLQTFSITRTKLFKNNCDKNQAAFITHFLQILLKLKCVCDRIIILN